MNKLITLALLAAISTLGTAQLSAQVSDGPCYDLRAFCNYDGNCENYWMPLLYITCNGAQGNWNAYAERYEIASPGMLPPPGSTGPVNQQPSYQNMCPAIPPEPPPLNYPGGYRVYPHLVAHTYYNTPPGCSTYTWEYDGANPNPQ